MRRHELSTDTIPAAVEVRGLVKRFGRTVAVDGVDLSVTRGSVFGLLGPNGAGKTTLVRMLATLLRPDAGSARVLGFDVLRDSDAVRGRVGLTGQFASVDEDLTGRENLIMLGRLYGLSRPSARARADDLLEAFGIADAGRRPVKTYSGGMRRRVDIAASIIVTPEIVFLDEPTTGLDPHSRNQVWGIIRALVAEGTTVLLTTQYLEEADQLSDRIAVIDHGRIVAEGTSSDLKSRVGTGSLHVKLRDRAAREAAARLLTEALGDGVRLEEDPEAIAAQVSDRSRVAPALSRLNAEGIDLVQFSMGQPSLDEVFLALTGHDTEESANPKEER
jgi:ABC-2 type transport system ATP-binding protein